jgi:hypothetical protein
MGQPDLYPFVLSPPVMVKLQYVHELIQQAASEAADQDRSMERAA